MTGQAASLRRLLDTGRCYVAPGVFSPSVGVLAEKKGFRVLYFSGAAFSNLQGLPDLGVTTLTEVSDSVRRIASTVRVPLIVDVDTGFGEAVNVGRTVREMVSAGAAAVQIEDQVLPKRCGHLGGKELVAVDEMLKKLIAAKEASSGRLLVIARTDARAVEGMEGAVERARAYQKAGVDMIFPEALESKQEFAEFRKKTALPLLANMTEFGRTPYTTASEFEALGYSVVIFPVTAFRAMMKSAGRVFDELAEVGSQERILGELMTRKEYNDLIGYREYEESDRRAHRSAERLLRRRAR